MIEDCKVVNENYKNQKKNTKEKENWIDIDEIKYFICSERSK